MLGLPFGFVIARFVRPSRGALFAYRVVSSGCPAVRGSAGAVPSMWTSFPSAGCIAYEYVSVFVLAEVSLISSQARSLT